MNPLQETEMEINEVNYPEVISEVVISDAVISDTVISEVVISDAVISDAVISQSAVQTDGIVEMLENRYSETETNRMEWVYILWQASILIVTGIVVCIVFYYIS